MWPFNRKEERDPRHNHDFSEQDREFSINVRKLKMEEKKLEYERRKLEHDVAMAELQEKLEDIRSAYEPETEEGSDGADAMMMGLLSSILMKGNAPVAVSASSTTPTPNTKERLTDEQLREILDTVPKGYRKLAKGMSDETLTGLIRSKLPNLDDDSINRGIQLIRM
jgi:hypothetical protein